MSSVNRKIGPVMGDIFSEFWAILYFILAL